MVRNARQLRGFVVCLSFVMLTIQIARTQPLDVFGQCEGTSPGGVSSERAILACSTVLLSPSLRPERRPSFLERRASLFLATNQFDKAIADYDKAIELSRGTAHLYNQRCWARAVAGRELELALADCDMSLKLRPKNASALDSRGLANFRKADYASAIADLNAALALIPTLESSLYVRGLAKRRSGDIVGSDADIASAKAIDPKIAERYASYGVSP